MTSRLCISEDGAMALETTAQQTASLEDVKRRCPSLVAQLAAEIQQGETLVDAWLPDTVIMFNPGVTFVARRLRAIRFNTSWDLVTGFGGKPEFQFSGSYNEWKKPLAFDWVPPKDMLVLIISKISLAGTTLGGWLSTSPSDRYSETSRELYLVVGKLESGSRIRYKISSWYQPPIPNLHPDLRLCTGAIAFPQNFHQLSWMEQVDAHLHAWSSNRWNRDLIPDAAKLARLIRFDDKGAQVMDGLDNWPALMHHAYRTQDLKNTVIGGLVKALSKTGWRQYSAD